MNSMTVLIALEVVPSQLVNGRVQPNPTQDQKAKTYMILEQETLEPRTILPVPMSAIDNILAPGEMFGGVAGFAFNGTIVWFAQGDDDWALKQQGQMTSLLRRMQKYAPKPPEPQTVVEYYTDWGLVLKAMAASALGTFLFSFVLIIVAKG